MDLPLKPDTVYPTAAPKRYPKMAETFKGRRGSLITVHKYTTYDMDRTFHQILGTPFPPPSDFESELGLRPRHTTFTNETAEVEFVVDLETV